MKSTTLIFFALLGLLICAPSAQAGENDGFLYGRITASSGTVYEGMLRWGNEESFWDDHFNSSKEDLPWMEAAKDELKDQGKDRRERRQIKVFGYSINIHHGDFGGASRQFIARFGDLERIEPRGSDGARIFTKNGGEYEVDGYSNDVGGTVNVVDRELGAIALKWKKIESIEFLPTPSDLKPGATRLRGKVTCSAGELEGFIQWDKQECLSTDILDGDSEDGDMEIEMGRIRSIERRGRRSSRVELMDGRKLRLRGSNDVDDDNRGIVVEDPRFGRVEMSWDEFDKVEFLPTKGSGEPYSSYQGESELRGTVETSEGESIQGRIIYDLDEAAGWELLNGRQGDVEFSVPFRNIREIRPTGRDGCLIILHSGIQFELEDGQDVSGSNDGILVIRGDEHHYVGWEEVRSIKLES